MQMQDGVIPFREKDGINLKCKKQHVRCKMQDEVGILQDAS
jgi:hypothetical protein